VPVGLKQRGESISLNPVTKLTLNASAESIGGKPDAVISIPRGDCAALTPVPPVRRIVKYEVPPVRRIDKYDKEEDDDEEEEDRFNDSNNER